MTNSRELAISDISLILSRTDSLPANPKRQGLLFKILLVMTVALFAFVYLPPKETFNPTLTDQNLLMLANQDRMKNGLTPFRESLKLQKAAEAKARDILEKDYFAHTSPAGLAPWDFIKHEGFAYTYAGENLAINYTSAYELENDFLKSPTHRANLLSPLFSEIGIAIINGSYRGNPAVITVQMFASPAKAVAAKQPELAIGKLKLMKTTSSR